MRILRFLAVVALLAIIPAVLAGRCPAAEVMAVPLKGSVNPATAELVLKSIQEAQRRGAAALILELDTPGGLLSSTRDIVEGILGSRVPVVAYVSPAGAQCASAGTFIALACPILAMAPGTNIGAAHPVTTIGRMDQTMETKVVNDAAAWITSLAARWGRNAQWAEDAVRRSVSVGDKEAVTLKVADLSASDLNDLLTKIDGRTVRLAAGPVVLHTRSAQVEEIKLDLRHRILQSVSDPTIAYILLLLGILGIIYEFSAPGLGVPGVVGLICIILAFYGMSALPINIAGVALVFVAVAFFVMEAHSHSFGLLGTGGIVSLVFATLLLIKPYSYVKVASRVSALTASLVFAAFLFSIVRLAYRATRRKVTTGKEGLIGEEGQARTDLSPEGTVYVHGEYWTGRSADGAAIGKGEKVRVEEISGSVLVVRRSGPAPAAGAGSEE